MAHKCQAIVIGVGDIGAEVVDQFLAEYGRVEHVDAEPIPREHVAVVEHREAEASRDGQPEHGLFRSWDETSLLESIAGAFHHLLDRRPVQDYGHTYYLDVFLCGAWRDDEFRHHLPLILPFLECIAHQRYASLFNGREDTRNNRFMIHPLTLSVNMPREAARDEIAQMIVKIEHWHRELGDRGESIIPRFFIYDGFTNNIQLNDAEIVGITANFLGLCTRAGVRSDGDFRRLLNFNTYSEDFFSVLNLATVHFPREYFRDRTRKIIARQFYSLLTERPDRSSELTLSALPDAELMSMFVRDKVLSSRILGKTKAPLFYEERIGEILDSYEGRIDPDSPAVEPGLRQLFERRRSFPDDAARHAPESLERFFDRRWLEHLLASCYPPSGRGVSATLRDNINVIRGLWHQELGEIRNGLERKLESLLGPGLGNYSLATFAAALQRCDEVVDDAQGELQDAQQKLPQRRWRFSAVRSLWARMRGEIWNFIPAHAIWLWLPLFAVLSSAQLLALYRVILNRIEPTTPGAALLRQLDAWPGFLPVLIVVSWLFSVVPLWILAAIKRRRLKRFLDTNRTDSEEDLEEFVDDESPTLLGLGRFRGLFPSAGSLMARKSGRWWHKHERLGALGLVRGLLQLVRFRIREVGGRSAKVLARLDALLENDRLFDTAEPRESLYFNDYLVGPADAEWFAQEINRNLSIKISAQNVAARLHRAGVDEFLQTAADRNRVFEEIEQEIPFFVEGSVFLLPTIEAKITEALRCFLRALPDRLSHGQIFHFLASEEHDKLIEDTEILIVCPPQARTNLVDADRDALSKYKVIVSSEPDHIYGLRVIRDVSVLSMTRYLYADRSQDEIDAMLRAWRGESDPESIEPVPWQELRGIR